MTNIRRATSSEDNVLSHILCNAFLPIWNHNWFQGVSSPLSPVPIKPAQISTTSLTSLQRARVEFYLSLIKATRLLGGEVLVNVISPSNSSVDSQDPEDVSYGAILLWLPPHKRMGITNLATLYSSGFLRTMYKYGFTGIHRVDSIFEANIAKMFKAAKVVEADHNFVQMLASNPEYQGKRYASQLLRWKIESLGEGSVVLDTTTAQGIRAYERMGFKLLGEIEVQTGCDEHGIKLRKGETSTAKHIQRVMMLEKGAYIKSL
jgi:ribosomal protein S18 acetylase RimI-like enzyme